MKICNICKIEKENHEFHKDSSRKDGLSYTCKVCQKDVNKQHAKANKERNLLLGDDVYQKDKFKRCPECEVSKNVKEFSKQMSNKDGLQGNCKSCCAKYATENKDKLKSSARKRYNENKHKPNENAEEIRIRMAEYSKNNPEKNRVKSAKWAKANPDKINLKNQNRRARKKAVGGTLSPDLYPKLFKLQRGCCAICKIKLPLLGDSNPMDHVIPITPKKGNKAGTNTDDNMQILCKPCNNKKYNKDPIDHMQSLGFLI